MSAPMWIQACAVAAGGAAGSLARWGVYRHFQGMGWDRLPLATLAVNVIGCAGIGALGWFLVGRPDGGERVLLRATVVIGVLGGFTTFSAFGLEVFDSLRAGRPGVAFGIVAANVLLGTGAVALGWVCARAVAP